MRLLAAAILGAGALGVPAQSASADGLARVSISVRGEIPDHAKTTGRMTVRDGGRAVFRGRIGIERRGQSSQMFPKLGYGIELRTSDGSNRDAALLGMPADEVTLNGRYHGVYTLMEKLKLHDDRLDVPEPAQLVEWTFGRQVRQKRERSFRLPVSGYHILFEDPAREDLGPERIRAIRAGLSAAERALHARGFRRPAKGWRAHLDEGAAVDFLLVNELFKNQDAFRASTFLHRGAGGRWALGPVWDFDISMGNSDYGESAVLAGSMLAKRSWGGRFYRDPALVAAMRARWRTLREQGLKGGVLRDVDRTARRLERTGAAGRNFRRWPVLGVRVWPNPPAAVRRTTYGAEVRALRSWLVARIAWLDRNVGRLG